MSAAVSLEDEDAPPLDASTRLRLTEMVKGARSRIVRHLLDRAAKGEVLAPLCVVVGRSDAPAIAALLARAKPTRRPEPVIITARVDALRYLLPITKREIGAAVERVETMRHDAWSQVRVLAVGRESTLVFTVDPSNGTIIAAG